jgi:hypothetical protein
MRMHLHDFYSDYIHHLRGFWQESGKKADSYPHQGGMEMIIEECEKATSGAWIQESR